MEMTIPQAAKYINRSEDLIWMIIKRKRIHATKKTIGKRLKWVISEEDLKAYMNSRYDKKITQPDLYDKSKGLYSVEEIAEKMKCPIQHVYYAIRTNKIQAHRKGHHWVLDLAGIEGYVPNLRKRRKGKS